LLFGRCGRLYLHNHERNNTLYGAENPTTNIGKFGVWLFLADLGVLVVAGFAARAGGDASSGGAESVISVPTSSCGFC